MLVDLIEVKTNEKEALKNFLKKIPLLSKVIQFNRGINDINLKYIEYKILKYKINILFYCIKDIVLLIIPHSCSVSPDYSGHLCF